MTVKTTSSILRNKQKMLQANMRITNILEKTLDEVTSAITDFMNDDEISGYYVDVSEELIILGYEKAELKRLLQQILNDTEDEVSF